MRIPQNVNGRSQISHPDGEWVDMPHDGTNDSDTDLAQRFPAEATQTPRRRNTGRFTHGASPSRRQIFAPTSPRRSRRGRQAPEPEVTPQTHATALPSPRKPAYEPVFVLTREELAHGFEKGIIFTVRYSLDILKRVIMLLKIPLSFFIVAWILTVLLVRLSNILRSAFSPLCFVPGISSLAICRPVDLSGGPHTNSTGKGPNDVPKWADYPTLVSMQSTAFEQLLGQSTGGLVLSLNIKKAEMAVADLATLVRASDLRSREVLADTLSTFVRDARQTGIGLQRLNAKMGGALDKIMAVNDYALRTIEDAETKRKAWNVVSYLVPWRAAPPAINEVVIATFTDAMNVVAEEMWRLNLEAEVSVRNLNGLEEHLTTMYDIAYRENSSLAKARDDLLVNLWTILGGNRRELRGLDQHLYLLKNLGGSREIARYVEAVSYSLQAMNAEMEHMRERVAAPELTAGRTPVEVHMKSIQSGIDRLKEWRLKAREADQAAYQQLLES